MTTIEYNNCVDLYADGIYRFVLKNIRDEEKAKDIVQETFLKLWEKVSTVSYEKAKSYLFTTAYHTMIDGIRKDNRQTELTEAECNMHFCENKYNDLKQILNEALTLLPEIQRSVLMLRDYEGYSYKEIGEILNLSESQVKVYIFRARSYLKNYIGALDKVI